MIIIPPLTTPPPPPPKPGITRADAGLAANEIQDLSDVIPELVDLSAAHQTPLRFVVSIECGDGNKETPKILLEQINTVLEKIKLGWRFNK